MQKQKTSLAQSRRGAGKSKTIQFKKPVEPNSRVVTIDWFFLCASASRVSGNAVRC